jgi:hypothetical protein
MTLRARSIIQLLQFGDNNASLVIATIASIVTFLPNLPYRFDRSTPLLLLLSPHFTYPP